MPHADGATVLPNDLDRLVGEHAQLVRIGPAESCLNPAALTGTQEKLLGDGIGIRVIFVDVFLNCGLQPVDLVFVIHVDQKLYVGSVVPFRVVDQQETESATSDERGDVGYPELALNKALDRVGERLRFANMGARRQINIDQ